MKTGSKALRIVECGLLLCGLLMLALFAAARIHRFVMFRTEMANFEARQLESGEGGTAGIEAIEGASQITGLNRVQSAEYADWSIQRTRSYRASLGKPVESLAVLRIPALHLEVPIFDGTDEITLNRGAGRIAGTSLPGQGGNIGIAGHRDGFFRRLKDIRTGDTIELVTVSGKDVFIVDRIRVTSPADVGVLRPRTRDSVTLVTCYPFYFVGPAPRRFIVEASLRQ